MLDAHMTRNGITVHIVDTDKIAEVFPNEDTAKVIAATKFIRIPSCVSGDGMQVYVTTMLSFGDIAQFILGDETYDFAMPHGHYKDGHVWYYAKGDNFGKPFDVMTAFYKAIRLQYNWA